MKKLNSGILKELDQWGPIDSKILYVSFWFLPTATLAKKQTGIGWPPLLGAFEHDRLTFFWAKSGMAYWGNKALEKWILPPSKRKKLWQRYIKLTRAMKQLAGQIEQLKASDEIKFLRPMAEKWYQTVIDFWCITLVPEIANYAAPAYLRKKLEKAVPPENMDRVLEALLAPEALSFHQQSELELLKLISGSRNKNALKIALEAYAKKWFWVENSYYENKYLSGNYFLAQSKKYGRAGIVQKIRQIQNYPKRVIKNKRLLIKQYHLNSSAAQMAESMAFSIWWQDHRKGLAWWAHSATEKLSHAACRNFKLSADDLMHYTAEEWRDLFRSNKLMPRSLIAKRKKFVLADVQNNGYSLRYGAGAGRFVKKLKATFTAKKTAGVLQGIVASRGQGGKIVGRVCVLHSPRNSAKMKPGQILVSPMTSPDFILAMRKAKAIVTDVGGLMSHAAVVARELGVASIVGTKTATKILKDGDLIEINCNSGVVKKI